MGAPRRLVWFFASVRPRETPDARRARVVAARYAPFGARTRCPARRDIERTIAVERKRPHCLRFLRVIYLLGGPPRSKKTTVAEHLAKSEGIPFIGTDALAFMLQRAAPQLGIGLGTDADERRSALLPFVRALVECQTLTTPDYLIEGEAIAPADVPDLAEEFDIAACFAGYSSLTVDELLVKRPSWIEYLDDAAREALPAQIVERSRAIEADCHRLDLTYVDVSGSHTEAVARVVQALLASR